jgi:hypothetical protein
MRGRHPLVLRHVRGRRASRRRALDGGPVVLLLRRAAWPLGALGGDPPLCSAAARWRPLRCGLARAFAKPPRHLERDFHTRPLDACPYTVAPADALTTKVREGGRVNVHTSVATGVNARARTGSPVPIGAEPFRQGR